MASELVPVDRLRQQIEEIVTLEDAVTVAGHAGALAAAVRAANLGLQAQNTTAALRLRAERRLGQILGETVVHGSKYATLPEGVNRARSSRAQKLARIDDGEFGDYLAATMAAEKEITQAGALKLIPTQPREDRKNVADAFVVPPIDTQIARSFGLEASDIRADLIARAVAEALHTVPNPRYAFAWVKYHGIDEDGQIGESWTFGGIAAKLGKSREYAETLYLRGSNHVRGVIAVRALEELARLMAAA